MEQSHFEALGCGALLISDDALGLREELGDCLVITPGGEATAELIAYYLERPDGTTSHRRARATDRATEVHLQPMGTRGAGAVRTDPAIVGKGGFPVLLGSSP